MPWCNTYPCLVVGQTTIATGTLAIDWTPVGLFNFSSLASSPNVSMLPLPVTP